jgi:hypothetical protein
MSDLAELIAKFAVPEPNSGCWLWIGAVSRNGYGALTMNSRRRVATHVSLEAVGRLVPKGMQVCHSCDVPACVNPDHLFIGTQLDNIRDCIMKGRHVPGPGAKKGTRTDAKFCSNGHPRTQGNIYVRHDGHTGCRICLRATQIRRLARDKEKRAEALSIRPPAAFPCGPGHKIGPNLYVAPNGRTHCRACNRMAAERYAKHLRATVMA